MYLTIPRRHPGLGWQQGQISGGRWPRYSGSAWQIIHLLQKSHPLELGGQRSGRRWGSSGEGSTGLFAMWRASADSQGWILGGFGGQTQGFLPLTTAAPHFMHCKPPQTMVLLTLWWHRKRWQWNTPCETNWPPQEKQCMQDFSPVTFAQWSLHFDGVFWTTFLSWGTLISTNPHTPIHVCSLLNLESPLVKSEECCLSW